MTDYIFEDDIFEDDGFTDDDFAAMLDEDEDYSIPTIEDELADRGMSWSDFI